jgi:hypothetical protein
LQHSHKKDQEKSGEWVPWQTIVRTYGEAEAVRRLNKGTIAYQVDDEDPSEHLFRLNRQIDRQYIQQYIIFDTTNGCLETSCHSYYNMVCHVSDTTIDISYVIMLLYVVHRQFDSESKTHTARKSNDTKNFQQLEDAADNPDAVVLGPGGASMALLKHLGVSKSLRNTLKPTDSGVGVGAQAWPAPSCADSGVGNIAQAAWLREMAARLDTRDEGRVPPILGSGEKDPDSESPKSKAKGKGKGKAKAKGKAKPKAKAKAKAKAKSKGKGKGKNEKDEVPDDNKKGEKRKRAQDEEKAEADKKDPDEKGERGDTTAVHDKHEKLIAMCKEVEERCTAAVRQYDKSSVEPTESMRSKYEQVKMFEQKLKTETRANYKQDKSNCHRGREAVIIF